MYHSIGQVKMVRGNPPEMSQVAMSLLSQWLIHLWGPRYLVHVDEIMINLRFLFHRPLNGRVSIQISKFFDVSKKIWSSVLLGRISEAARKCRRSLSCKKAVKYI